jgi:signal-transduction protein with cAMP-binding, CBS, and nucleotidyltransferase domain
MPETSLVDAAATMWENDCGALPVVGIDDKVVGMITDRDICFGATTKNRPPSEVAVGEVITGEVFACAPEDDIQSALKTMSRERIRRLPVVGEGGTLEGILSMNDVVLKAGEQADGKAPELSYGEVVQTYKAICAHNLLPQLAQQPGAQAAGA